MYLEVADYWYFANPYLIDDDSAMCLIKETLIEYKEYIDRYYPGGYDPGVIYEGIKMNYQSAIDEIDNGYAGIICK